jgi:hypothetical protein
MTFLTLPAPHAATSPPAKPGRAHAAQLLPRPLLPGDRGARGEPDLLCFSLALSLALSSASTTPSARGCCSPGARLHAPPLQASRSVLQAPPRSSTSSQCRVCAPLRNLQRTSPRLPKAPLASSTFAVFVAMPLPDTSTSEVAPSSPSL